MRLQVFTPERVSLRAEVSKVIAEAQDGSFCLLPRHVDFAAALVPGILRYTDVANGEEFLAVDEGMLVKCGEEISVASRRAYSASGLDELQRIVRAKFQHLDDEQRKVRTAVARLEVHFVRRFMELVGHGARGL